MNKFSSAARWVGCLVLLLAASAMFAVSGSARDEQPAPGARVQVTWAPLEQLSEVKNNPPNRGWLRPQEWTQSIADHLRKSADRILPPGQQLRVHIDDISLAGRFEPLYRPGQQDARIMREVYSPWMNLHFVLLAPDGTMLREGDAKLRDATYLRRAVAANPSDPLRYDKRMIDDWLRREFGSER